MTENEKKEIWEPAKVHIQPGDTLTSKKGLLFPANLTGEKEFYRVTKVKYLGNGTWEAVKKEPVDVTPRGPGI